MNMLVMGMSEGEKREKRKREEGGKGEEREERAKGKKGVEGGEEIRGKRGRLGGEAMLLTFLRVSSASKRRE